MDCLGCSNREISDVSRVEFRNMFWDWRSGRSRFTGYGFCARAPTELLTDINVPSCASCFQQHVREARESIIGQQRRICVTGCLRNPPDEALTEPQTPLPPKHLQPGLCAPQTTFNSVCSCPVCFLFTIINMHHKSGHATNKA